MSKFKIVFQLILGALCAAALQAQESNNLDNVVVILDGSGSMSGMIDDKSKMQAAKNSVYQALKKLPDDTQFGLLVFSKNVNGWAYPLGPLDKTKVRKQVKRIKQGGKTPLGTFLKTGADSLLAERAKQFNYGTYRLIVITDGESTDGKLMLNYAPELVSRGITLNVIGVGMANDHSLKDAAHQYVGAKDVKSLDAAVTTFIAEVSSNTDLDAAGESPYDYLAFFPNNDAALSTIDALSESGNQPLGE
ncbi:MAG: vWA domain-containing protein [Verrucomicrobiota bacterium]